MSTHIKISTITVGVGGAASIDFTSIPATYTDLLLVLSGRGSTASVTVGLRCTFNGSAVSYSGRYLQGDGASASSGTSSTASLYLGETVGSTATASVFSSQSIYIPNYTSANYKSVSSDSVSETNAVTIYATLTAGLWSVTSAINQVTLFPTSGNFAQYSSATLYGIKSS